MDLDTVEAIKCYIGPWGISGEEYDFWEEYQFQLSPNWAERRPSVRNRNVVRHIEIMEVNTRESGRLEAVSRTPESNHGVLMTGE